jgi:hypothetical protein
VEATDTTQLTSPAGLGDWLTNADPQHVILGHAIPINRSWWDRELGHIGLPSGTVVSENITRAMVFNLAEAAQFNAPDAERLLWNAVAWGAGKKPRLIRKRIESVEADRTRLGELLREAAVLSRSSPVDAYTLLRPRDNAIKHLGPAFFTKFLYFAGGGNPDHPCCILDDRVAHSLQAAGWRSLPRRNDWWPSTYGRYMELLAQWKNETGATRLDLIERYLFDANGVLPS